MASTTKFGIDYPSENENPFWATYLSGMGELDDLLAIILEEASLLVVGGGTITLAAGQVQWTGSIYIVSGRTRQTITIAAGSTAISDGEIVSVSGVTRPLTNQTLSTFSASTSGPQWDTALLPLFYRRGDNVYMIREHIGLERLTLDLP